MSEEEIKALYKIIVEYGNGDYIDLEKEILKQAIDSSKNLQELFVVALASLYI